MSTTTIPQQFLVRTVGAGRVFEGRILAPTKSSACERAIVKHREALLDRAASHSFSNARHDAFLKARTASILVTTVEVITFEVGDTIGGDAA